MTCLFLYPIIHPSTPVYWAETLRQAGGVRDDQLLASDPCGGNGVVSSHRGLVGTRTQVLVFPNPHLGPGHEPQSESSPVAPLAQLKESSLHPLPLRVPPGAPAPGESREALSAAGKQRAALAGGAGPGRGQRALRRGQAGAPLARQDPAARAPLLSPAPHAGTRATATMGACLGACSLLSCVSPHPGARRAPPAHFCPVFFLQFLLFLPPNLSFWARTPPPRPLVPLSLGTPLSPRPPARGRGRRGQLLSGARVTAREGLGRSGRGRGVPSTDSPSGNWGD